MSLTQLLQNLQSEKTDKAINCPAYCAAHPCGHAGWVCGLHVNTVGLLVCGCYDPNQGGQ